MYGSCYYVRPEAVPHGFRVVPRYAARPARSFAHLASYPIAGPSFACPRPRYSPFAYAHPARFEQYDVQDLLRWLEPRDDDTPHRREPAAQQPAPAPAPAPQPASDGQPESSAAGAARAAPQAQPERPSTMRAPWNWNQTDDAHRLRKTFPAGVTVENLTVEFTDPATLVVKARASRGRTAAPRQPEPAAAEVQPTPAAEEEHPTDEQHAAPETLADADDVMSVSSTESAAESHASGSSNYQRPSVEDEYVDVGAAAVAPTPATIPAETSPEPESAPAAPAQPEAAQQKPYWTADFEWSFRLTGDLAHDATSAALEDGRLEIIVPKRPAPQLRRINVV